MQMAVFVPAQHSTLQTPWGPAFLGRQGNTWLDMSTDWQTGFHFCVHGFC